MKRYISKNDDDYYTYMLKLINSIGGRKLNYNWLIKDIEAYPQDESINNKLNNDYLFISNDELLDMLEKEDFQWIWGIFLAVPSNIKEKDILQYTLPSVNNEFSYNTKVLENNPFAEIEIDCIDSSYFVIYFKKSDMTKEFLECYPKSIEDINS